MPQTLATTVNELLSVQEQLRYEGFIKSMELLDMDVPALMVVGADTRTLQDAVFEDINAHISDYKLYENPLNDDDFRPIFRQHSDVPIILRFWVTDADDMLLTARQLLLFRDEIVRQNNRIIILVNEALYDIIISKTFDVIAAARFAGTFKNLQAQMDADFAPSTEKSWNEKKYERLLDEWKELQKTPEKNLRTQLNVGYKLGVVTYEMSRLKEALKYHQQLLELAEKLENKTEQINNLVSIGIIHSDKGDLNLALEYFEKAAKINKFTMYASDLLQQATIDTNIGLIYRRKGDIENALTYFENSLETSSKLGNFYGVGTQLLNIGALYTDTGKTNLALKYYKKALEMYRQTSYLHGQAETFRHIGIIHARNGHLQDALQYYNDALSLYKKDGSPNGLSDVLSDIADLYANNGNFGLALSYIKQALNINKHSKSRQLSILGDIYLKKGDFDNALKHYETALKINISSQNLSVQAVNISTIGMVEENRGELDKALKHYQEALNIFKKIGFLGNEANLISKIGGIHHSKGNLDKAFEYYGKALNIYKKIGDVKGEGYQWLEIGQLNRNTGDFQNALSNLNKALNIFKQVDSLMNEAVTLNSIGVLYASQNDPNRALSYLRQADNIYKKIGAENHPNAISTREQIAALEAAQK